MCNILLGISFILVKRLLSLIVSLIRPLSFLFSPCYAVAFLMLELHYVFYVPAILFECCERAPVHDSICYELYLMLCSINVLKE